MPTYEELTKELFEGPRDAGRSFARQQAVSQLLKLNDPRARESLLTLLRDPDRALRVQAIESLKPFKDGKVIFAVTQGLKDRDAEVRRVAGKWLGEMGDESVVHDLEEAADDESWFVQHECKSAIERIRARVRDAKAILQAIPIDMPAPPPAPAPAPAPAPVPVPAPVVVTKPAPSVPAPLVKGRPSDDDILRHVASRLCAAAKRTKQGASFSVQIDEKRRQTVQVLFQKSGKPPRDYVVFFTECGPAQPERFGDALKKNFRMHFGSIAIQDREGTPYFVLFDTIPRNAITPELAAEIARKVARHGDDFELVLGAVDKH